ncbi:MAG TPA: hypothetical protein VN496_11925, partial [Burkholderiales bacterium]|nr:hypothetical protein [Burkholderiales bacterium]
TRASTIQRARVMKHYLQAVAPACTEKISQQTDAMHGVVSASQRLIEDPNGYRSFCENGIDCRFVLGITEKSRVLRI